MARPPRMSAGGVDGAAEVVLVFRLGEPAGLAGGLAGRSAGRRRTVILVTAGTRGIGPASLLVLQRTDEFAKRQCAGGIEEQWLSAIDKLTRVRRCPVSPFAWDCK